MSIDTMTTSPPREGGGPALESTEREEPIQHDTRADQPSDEPSTPEKQVLDIIKMSSEDLQPRPAAEWPSRAHSGWEATSVAMARCDFCQLASRGVVQKCNTCKLSICKACFDNDRLANDPIHNIAEDEVNWEPLAKPRSSKKSASKGHRNRTAGGRVSRKRAAEVATIRPRTLAHILLDDTKKDVRSQLFEPVPRDRDLFRGNDRGLLNEELLLENELRERPKASHFSTTRSAAPCLDQLPYPYSPEEDSPAMSSVLPPRFSAHQSRTESLQRSFDASDTTGAQRAGRRGYTTTYHRPDTPSEEPTSPLILPRLADDTRCPDYRDEPLPRIRDHPSRFPQPALPREQNERRRTFDTDLSSARPVYHDADYKPDRYDRDGRPSNCQARDRSISDWDAPYHQRDTHSRLSPEPPRGSNRHERNHSGRLPSSREFVQNMPPPRRIRGFSDRTERHHVEGQVSNERQDTAHRADEWPDASVLKALALYLVDTARWMRHRNSDRRPLDVSLRDAIEREWNKGKLREDIPDDGEAYRLLLAATYVASVDLDLGCEHNAAKEWLHEKEMALRENGRSPIGQPPKKSFLPVD